jgi:hypothetical protein
VALWVGERYTVFGTRVKWNSKKNVTPEGWIACHIWSFQGAESAPLIKEMTEKCVRQKYSPREASSLMGFQRRVGDHFVFPFWGQSLGLLFSVVTCLLLWSSLW